jgi:glutathionylspermidine synthase
MRRLYRFYSRMTEEQVEEIIEGLDKSTMRMLSDFAERIDYVEFIDDRGFESSICSLNEIELDESKKIMDSIYGKDQYFYKDVTEEIMLERHDLACPEEATRKVLEGMIERHLDAYLTKDEILDKINILGIESLNGRDYKILES